MPLQAPTMSPKPITFLSLRKAKAICCIEIGLLLCASCVSGNRSITIMLKTIATAVKNTKILGQPNCSDINPPITGPIAGKKAKALPVVEYALPNAIGKFSPKKSANRKTKKINSQCILHH